MNYTTSYDSDLGWTHGYAMALKSSPSAMAWCENVSSLQSTKVTDELIPLNSLADLQADLDGLKHCNTAKQ